MASENSRKFPIQWNQQPKQTCNFCIRSNQSKLFVRSEVVAYLFEQTASNVCYFRLWTVPRNDTKKPIQKFLTLDLVPKLKISGYQHETLLKNGDVQKMSSLNEPQFETTSELVERLNSILKSYEIIGEIVNIETLPLPISELKWTVDSECLQWAVTSENRVKGMLSILRVHINTSSPVRHELVELLDFVPKMTTWTSPLAVPNMESFTTYSLLCFCCPI